MRPRSRGLLLEHPDELVADDAALVLGIGHAGEAGEEALARVDHDEVHPEVRLERLAQELRFALAHEPVVDVDARQPVADRPMDERRRDSGVDPTRQRADDLALRTGRGGVRVDALADPVDRRLDEVRGRPGGNGPADAQHEVGEHVAAARRVHDLGVELDAIEVARWVGQARVGRGVRLRRRLETGREARDRVGVAHPDRLLGAEAGKDAVGRPDADDRRAVLALRRAHDVAAELAGHELRAIADAEHGQAAAPDGRVGLRGAVVVDGVGAAREDHALRAATLQLIERRVVWQELGVDVELAHAARDELRELAAEVEDDDAVGRLRRDADRRPVVGAAIGRRRVERDLEIRLDLGIVGGEDAVTGVRCLAVDGPATRAGPLGGWGAGGRSLGFRAIVDPHRASLSKPDLASSPSRDADHSELVSRSGPPPRSLAGPGARGSIAAVNGRKRVLIAGESWVTHSIHQKGFDSFTTTSYHEGVGPLRAALESGGFTVDYLPNHVAASTFPGSAAELAPYDAVVLSDIGANTLLLHPDTFERSEPRPDRLAAIAEYVTGGGGLVMVGGYLTFAGIEGRARWAGTPVEGALPVTIGVTDDRVEVPAGVDPEVRRAEHPIVAWPRSPLARAARLQPRHAAAGRRGRGVGRRGPAHRRRGARPRTQRGVHIRLRAALVPSAVRGVGGVREDVAAARRMGGRRLTGSSGPNAAVAAVTRPQALAWRLERQLLEPVGDRSVPEVVRRLCGVQAQVASSADLAIRVRQRSSRPGDVATSLRDGDLLKTWAMRGSLHLLTPEDGGSFLALDGCGQVLGAPELDQGLRRDAEGHRATP